MGRMTITIDEALVDEAREALGVATKSEAIRYALRDLVRRKRLEIVLSHQGKVELDLDQEKLARLREEE